MIFKLEHEGKIQGIKIGRFSPPISHLFFVDDVMVFCRANKDNIEDVSKCLDQYCKWTGQLINLDKSRILFSKNTSNTTKAAIKQILNLKELAKDAKYLGNPLHVGANKVKAFEDPRNRIETKMQGRKETLISQAGRSTFIKLVVSAMPIYSMAFCKFPLNWCQGIETMARKFLWKMKVTDSRVLSPLAWRKVCSPKVCGGLRLKRFQDMKVWG